ncbi:MAG: ferrous iron transport protein [Acidobacteriota bacterium]|jgi:ferrous iron transport protein B|nr:ferrous iron transport protein [Acidobacteriota bacterium]
MSQLALSSSPSPARRILLVGQPNVGKSLIFTRLTNRYATVSNYPGTTVEITSALAEIEGELREIVDTPGTNTLAPQSFEERVTRDLLLDSGDADVVQVGDIGNLRRTLMLSLQLAEHEIAFTLCLNMSDEPDAPSIELARLADLIGVPVVAVSALRRWNLEKLKRHAVRPTRPRISVEYPIEVEAAIDELRFRGMSRIDALSQLSASDASPEIATQVAKARLAVVDEIISQVMATGYTVRGREAFGALCMHRIWGVPILLAVLYVAWLFVGKLGAGTLVDFVETTIFEGFVNPWATRLVNLIVPFQFMRDLLVGPYGVITMALTYAIAIVLPVVITFFTLFGILEDSGYLPRLAVMLHRTFRRMGLNGKAVLPMVLGLGCDTMATLTTRVLETKKERVIVTILLALGIPCSAQLGVLMAMLGRLGAPAVSIWLGVTLLTIFLVGFLASKVVPGTTGDFIVEIPPMRIPRLSNILIKVLARTEWYLKEAVPLFIVGTLLLYVLDATHLLTVLQRALSPIVVGALGLPAEAANAFVIGFLRRDYGAAGLFAMQRNGALNPNQTVIALTAITLFVPCVANFLVMVRERGKRAALAIAAFITVYAFGIGALLNAVFHIFNVRLV